MGVSAARLTLLAHAPTPATVRAAFPAGDDLDARGLAAAGAAGPAPRVDRVRHAPDPACSATCAALGVEGEPDAGLREWDPGAWAGRGLDEVPPADLGAWLSDPDAAPHGGESLTALLARVGSWLADPPPGHTLAVTGPAVVRAAVVVVLGAPPSAFWRLDVPPLSRTDLRGGPRRWTVRAAAAGRCP